jgi:hypothetical protein
VATAAEADEETAQPVARPAATDGSSGSGLRWLLVFAVLLAALAASAWLWWRARAPQPEPVIEARDLDPIAQPLVEQAAVGAAPPLPEDPVEETLWVRLVVVRGSHQGRQYNLYLRDKAVVGKRSDCDCVLSDEPGVGQTQFEIFQRDGQLFIRNLDPQNPTLLDGLPIEGEQGLRSDTLVGTHETILRIVYH